MDTISIAYFITHHGFGHAARASAVMAALLDRQPRIRFEIFTQCPQWLFNTSLPAPFGYHAVQTDVGIVQISPLEEDLPATCRQLERWLPFDPQGVAELAGRLRSLNCRMVICDISALGIAAAREAGLPSVLVESFSWSWIYDQYVAYFPALTGPARQLGDIYDQVDLRIQTEPLCQPLPGLIRVYPVYRRPRTDRATIRRRLGIPKGEKMVLVSMGGVPDRFAYLDHLPDGIKPWLVFPGTDGLRTSHPRVRLLPTYSDFYHPDLIQAADVLVGKAGYSTIAEGLHTGLPFGFILRPGFPESACLERFIETHMQGRSIPPEDYTSGRWIEALPELLALSLRKTTVQNGADQIARILMDRLDV